MLNRTARTTTPVAPAFAPNGGSILGPAIVAIALAASACTNLDSRVVDHDGRAVEIVTAGSGSATVVFEAGLGNDWKTWDAVASDIAKDARVFAYSRPGYGKSEATTTPRDPATIVEELRDLLGEQGYVPPYILVGHSFGGTYMELFAKAHPGEVAGAVLVEPRHRDFLAQCEAAHLDLCGISASDLATQPATDIAEYEAFPRASAEVAAAGPFGSYPVRVLTATGGMGSPARRALWEATHASLAAEAADGRQIVFPGATHALPTERATEVATVIRALLPSTPTVRRGGITVALPMR